MIIVILIVAFILAALGGLFFYDRYVKCPKCGKYTYTKVTGCSPNNFNRRPAMLITASSGVDSDGNKVAEAVPHDLTVEKREYKCKCGHTQTTY